MKVLDLFSGIGGFSLGLERAGFSTLAFCEIDENARKVLRKNWPDTPIFEDVTKLKAKHLDELPEVICGGFPCQDVSVAGQKKGLEHEGKRTRSGLWEEFKRLIQEVEPRYVIIENVANLRNLGLNQVIKDLWKVGYGCEWHIISARSVGACHLRERIWIIAYPYRTEVRNKSKRKEKGRNDLQGQGETFATDNGEAGDLGVAYANSTGRKEQQSTERKRQEISTIELRSNDPADSHLPRLWKPFTSEEEKSLWWAEATASFRDWWQVEPSFRRVDARLSDWMGRLITQSNAETMYRLNKTVSYMWGDVREKEIWEAIGGLDPISFEKNLLTVLWKLERESKSQNDISLTSKEVAERFLRELRYAGQFTGTSYRQECEEQYGKQYSDFMCELPHETSLARRFELLAKTEKARRERIKQLGNSVVPAIPELIGRAILEYESR